MKRILSVLLIAALCLSLTACGSFTDLTEDDFGDDLRIGIVSTTDADDSYSEAAAFHEQILSAVKSLGLTEQQLSVRDDISTTNSALAEEAIETCLKEGCSIIFGTSAGFATAMKNKAAAYPDVTFVGLGDPDSSLTNYYAFHIKMYEGAYLSGLIAGIQSKEGKLGMIAPAAVNDPQTCQIANAFLLGARVQKPEATLTLLSTGAAESESKEREAVTALKEAGCDMLLIATKGSKAVEAATDAGMKCFTMYTMPDTSNEAVLYSVMPRLTDVFVDTVQAVLSEQPPYFTNMYVGYRDGLLHCRAGTVSSEEVVGDTYVLPGAVQNLMLTEEWDVFSGEAVQWKLGELTRIPAAVKNAAGEQKIAASAGAPSYETLSAMTWLMEGVTVKE